MKIYQYVSERHAHMTCSWTVAVPVTFRGGSPDGASVLVALHVYRPACVRSSRRMRSGLRPSCTGSPFRSHHVAAGMTGGLATAVEHSRLTVDPSTAVPSDVAAPLTRTDTDTFGPSATTVRFQPMKLDPPSRS